MTRMVEELESREGEWKDSPMAARNKLLLKKWKERIKVRISIEALGLGLKLRSELRCRLELKSRCCKRIKYEREYHEIDC